MTSTAAARTISCTLSAALVLSLLPALVEGQDYERVAPNVPLKADRAVSVPASAPTAGSSSQTTVVASLKALIFVAGFEKLIMSGQPVAAAGSSGINTSQIPELADRRFTSQFADLLGQPATLADLDRIKTLTTNWLRSHGRPFVDVSVPPQSIASGVVQIVVTEYRLGRVEVEGAHHFSPSLIRNTSGLASGQTLRLDDLQTDLDRLNRNPFLNVDAVFKPGAQTGETDLTLKAKDRLPLRVYSGFDNLGVRSLGVSEFNSGVNWGNAFGTGQILSYQFTRSISGRSTSHSISDTIPLPSGDQLLVFGSYGQQRPTVAEIFNDQGHSGQASVRYAHVLPSSHRFNQDVQVGYDFKTTDNNLEFAGFQVFAGQAEVDQFPLVYDAAVTTRLGQTAVQNVFVFSPGGLSPNNNRAALSGLAPDARAHYLYDRFLVTQTAPLPGGFSAVTRITMQASTHNLPYSEQVGGGGVGSVRGYYTDTALGSEGAMFSQELRLPAFAPSKLFDHSSEFSEKAQFGTFFDYAELRQIGHIVDVNNLNLASAGFLLRYSISRSLDVQYDMGWRLRSAPTVPQLGAYGQISLTGSF